MNPFAEFLAALRIGLAGLPQRAGSSLVIIVGVACTVAVLVSMLALSAGLRQAFVNGGADSVAIVLAREAAFEWQSSITRTDVLLIENAPGIARGAVAGTAALLVSPEVDVQLPAVPGVADGSLRARGIRPAGFSPAIRPHFRIVSGRLFRTGAQELIVGAAAARVHGEHLGRSVLMPDGDWPIVGIFTDGGSIAESELLADADTLLASSETDAFASVLVALQGPATLNLLRNWLESNSRLSVSAEMQSHYLDRTGRAEAQSFRDLAYAMGLVMAIGALFACIKILYASVRVRSREIATLRALGYSPRIVAASVLVEGVLLCLVGAAFGGAAAWGLFDGRHASDYNRMFDMSVTPALLATGFAWAVLLAVAGGAAPAVRAARLRVIDALRGG